MAIKEDVKKFIIDRFLFGDDTELGGDTDSFLDKIKDFLS